MPLVKKAPTVQIPAALYERVQNYEGGKYTPRSVVCTAVEEWLDAKARAAAATPIDDKKQPDGSAVQQ